MWGYPSLNYDLQYDTVRACGIWLGEMALLGGPLPPLSCGFPAAVYVGPRCCFVWSTYNHATLMLVMTAIYVCFCRFITLWLWIPTVNIDTFTGCIVMAICRFARRHKQEEEEAASFCRCLQSGQVEANFLNVFFPFKWTPPTLIWTR